ncbi:MAG: polysaccharide deacetylase family protein [Alphaproteobacteria bacterium]
MADSRIVNKVNNPAAMGTSFRREFANWDGLRTVCLTFDQDWAPDFMVTEILDLLDRYAAKATFLATGPSDVLSGRAAAAGHEIALHPNLAAGSTQGRNIEEIATGLRRAFPQAVGTRFHLLGHSYRDLMVLSRHGFLYDVSSLRFNCPYLLPAWHADIRMTLLSYCWEDGFSVDGDFPSSVDSIDLDSPGMKILNFHPLNVYLNCERTDQKTAFQAAIPNLSCCTMEESAAFRNAGKGSGQVLHDLLQLLDQRNVECVTLRDLVAASLREVGE